MNTDIKTLQKLSQQIPQKMPYVKMLLLFGSRARGDIHEKSDWDFAILYDQEIRKEFLKNNNYGWFGDSSELNDIFNLKTDYIDVVDLNNCSDFIAHYIALDGILLYEKNQGEFDCFRENKVKTQIEIKKLTNIMRNKVESFLLKRGV